MFEHVGTGHEVGVAKWSKGSYLSSCKGAVFLQKQELQCKVVLMSACVRHCCLCSGGTEGTLRAYICQLIVMWQTPCSEKGWSTHLKTHPEVASTPMSCVPCLEKLYLSLLLSWVQGINLFQCLRLEKRETLVREKSMRWALGCVPAGPSPPPDATSWATKPQTPTETFPILPSLPVPVLISQGKASCKSLSSLHLNKSLPEPLASNKWEGFMITVWLTSLW